MKCHFCGKCDDSVKVYYVQGNYGLELAPKVELKLCEECAKVSGMEKKND